MFPNPDGRPTGQHLLLTFTGCATPLIDDEAGLVALVGEAAAATGAQVLQVISRRFEPQGVTVLALLAESHASLHTYPEHRLIYWDCFTCGPHCDPTRSITVLAKGLRPSNLRQQVVTRR